MSISTMTETNWNGLQLAAVCPPSTDRTERIVAALGLSADGVPRVNEETLARYYAYLSANLSLPFTAYYPQPTTPQEKTRFRCRVLELLDPTQYLGDEFDGILCRIRKGKFEVYLPLIELHVPDDSPVFQLIEDYCHWFLNWR